MIKLIFPPQWIPNHPYLAPFLLSARARAKGVECNVYDFNLLFYRAVIDKKKIDKLVHSEAFFNPSTYNLFLQKVKDSFDVGKDFAEIELFNARFKYKAYRSYELWKAVKSKNNFFNHFFMQLLKDINIDNCRVLGISIISYSQLIPSLTLAYIAKQLKPDLKIIVGGDMISRISNALAEEGKIWKYIDAVISGDGEYAIDSIADFLKNDDKIDFKKVPNAISKNTKSNTTEKRSFNFREYKMPDYSDIDFKDYLSPFPVATIEMSRGCYWSKCLYCETTNIPFRKRGIQEITDEVEFLYMKHGIQHFSFADLAIPSDKLFQFSAEIIKRKLPIYWKGMVRAEKIFTKEKTDMLYKGGCRMLLIGIESANANISSVIKKGIKLTALSNLLENIRESNIWIHGYFIIDFPGETDEQIMDTLDFIQHNNININSFSISKFVLLRDSDFFKKPELFNIVVHKDQKDNLRTAYFNFKDVVSHDMTSIDKKIKEILESHPYDYLKWKNLDINYLFLCIAQRGTKYFMKGIKQIPSIKRSAIKKVI